MTNPLKKYKIITHLLSFVTILLTFTLIGLDIYNYKLIQVESNLNYSGIKLYTFTSFVILCSLTTAFFAGCSINGDLKVYLFFFTIYIGILIVLYFLILAYLYFFSVANFMREVNNAVSTNSDGYNLIKSLFNERDGYAENVEHAFIFCKQLFTVIISLYLIIFFFNYLIARAASKITYIEPTIEIKRDRVGMSTNTLRQKYSIDTNSNIDLATAYPI